MIKVFSLNSSRIEDDPEICPKLNNPGYLKKHKMQIKLFTRDRGFTREYISDDRGVGGDTIYLSNTYANQDSSEPAWGVQTSRLLHTVSITLSHGMLLPWTLVPKVPT